MNNFTFQNSTKLLFGRDAEKNVGEQILPYGSRVLFVNYGDDFILNSPVYARVSQSLKDAGLTVFELQGIRPNPLLSKVREGIALCKREHIDFVLALGGGSVIDTAKSIGLGATCDWDVWEHYTREHVIQTTLPVGVVLTIPATGSETSAGSVITNDETHVKLLGSNGKTRPVFAIMNPEVTYTVPRTPMVAGGVDMMSHVMERYFTPTTHTELTDRLCEATLKTIIHNLPLTLADPQDYNSRSEIVFSGTLAHNGLLDCGRTPDWACHFISHILGGYTNLSHGFTLSILTPHWMRYVYRENLDRFVQFAMNVWDIPYCPGNPEQTALEGIAALEGFFRSLGAPLTLAEAGIRLENPEEIARLVVQDGPVGNLKKLDAHDVQAILESSAE